MLRKINVVIFICFVLMVAISIVGYSIDGKGFIGNILSEIAGMAFGILFTIFIVDKYAERQKQNNIMKIKDIAYRKLIFHLCRSISFLGFYYDIPDDIYISINGGAQRFDKKKLNDIRNLIDLIDRGLVEAKEEFMNHHEAGREYFKEIEWEISQIRNIWLPRILSTFDDNRLIELLIELDCTIADVELHEINDIKAKELVEKGVMRGSYYFHFSIRLTKVSYEICDYLLKEYGEDRILKYRYDRF